MKTVKFILPVVAIVAAVASVFATGNSAPALNNVPVTARTGSPCVRDGVCDTDTSTKKCQLASGILLYNYSTPTSCGATQIAVGAFVADQPNNP